MPVTKWAGALRRTFDRVRASRHNGFVRRLLFLIGLFALLWTAADRTAAAAQDTTTLSAAALCEVAGDSQGPSDSERYWRARQHTVAAVTESHWKSAPVHAALGATPAIPAIVPAPIARSSGPPAPSAPPYLRHTPLLI